MHCDYRVWKLTRQLALLTQECVTCNLPKMASNIARSTWPARTPKSHTHTTDTHTHSLSQRQLHLSHYMNLLWTLTELAARPAATTFFTLRQRRFSTVFYLFNFSFLYFCLLFGALWHDAHVELRNMLVYKKCRAKILLYKLLLLYLWHAQWADWQKLFAIKKFCVRKILIFRLQDMHIPYESFYCWLDFRFI